MNESDEELFNHAVKTIGLNSVEIPDDDELIKIFNYINSNQRFQTYKQKFDRLDYQSKKDEIDGLVQKFNKNDKNDYNTNDDFMNMLFANQSGGVFNDTPGKGNNRSNNSQQLLQVGGFVLIFILLMYSLIYGNNDPSQARNVINNHQYGPNAPGRYAKHGAPGSRNYNLGGRKRTKRNRKSKNRRQKNRRKSIRRRR